MTRSFLTGFIIKILSGDVLVEIWKDVAGYEWQYRVSNFGRVYSLKTNKALKPHREHGNGYVRLILRKNGKSYSRSIHRIVAEAFVSNENAFAEVNHKDENKANNRADNLEWCSRAYNNSYGTKIQRTSNNTDHTAIADKTSKPVAQCDFNNKQLKIWKSANECKRVLGFDNSSISKCCRGEMSNAYGYKWSYCG